MPCHELHLNCCHDSHDAQALVGKLAITLESLQLNRPCTEGNAVYGSVQVSSCHTGPEDTSSCSMPEMSIVAV